MNFEFEAFFEFNQPHFGYDWVDSGACSQCSGPPALCLCSGRQPPPKRPAAAPHGALTVCFAALRTNRRDGGALGWWQEGKKIVKPLTRFLLRADEAVALLDAKPHWPASANPLRLL